MTIVPNSKTNHQPFFLAVKLTLLTLCLAALPFAWADNVSQVKVLMDAGKLQDALTLVNQELATKPNDVRLRFFRGLVLADLGRSQEAIPVFQKLTQDAPLLPEPFNNLAVLYAGTGQFDKAKATLEMAIKTNPSYATAHENLGDIYTKMAADAYSKALQLDVSKTQVQPKLALIRNMGQSGSPNSVAAAPTPATSTKPVATKPASAPAVASAPDAVSTSKPEKKPEAANLGGLDSKQVEAAVTAWMSAWSARNVPAYLASYTPDFLPPSGGSRKAWEADRKEKILGKSKISVKMSDLVVTGEGSQAIAKFRQIYRADTLLSSTRKTLHLVKRDGRWLISKEIAK
jgi:tetratricopeptide (TPR) repeat protein